MRRALVSTLVSAVSLSCVESTRPTLIPRAVLFDNPARISPQISPDGQWLAYLAPSEGVQNVWVRTIGGNDDRVVTSESVRPIFDYDWRPDSKHILYRLARGGDGIEHLYQANVESMETRDLTPFEGRAVGTWEIHPAFPDQMLLSLQSQDQPISDRYRLNLNTGALELDTENPGDLVGFVADNEMTTRVASSRQPDGGQEIRVRQDEGSPWRLLQRWGPGVAPGGALGFSADNEAVRLISSAGANAIRLVEVDITTGEETVLAEDQQYDVAGSLWHPEQKSLQAVAFHRERLEWEVLDSSLQRDFEALRRVRDGDFRVRRDYADTTWLVAYSTDIGPVYYYAYDRASRAASFLFAHRPELENYRLAAMEPISFEARDGMILHGYLTKPVGIGGAAPMVLLVHGGPWSRDSWGFNPLVQMLANRGYAVLQVNFRGSRGYGKAYLNAGDREWGGKMQDDLLDAREWAVELGHALPDSVAIMGQSYGGYATMSALAFTPGAFACGISISGISNLLTFLSRIQGSVKGMYDQRVGDPVRDADFLESRSPLFQAHKIQKPMLIVHGAKDRNVSPDESDQLVERMRANGIPVRYIVFPNEGHNFGYWEPENSLRLMAAVEQFLSECLGGRSEPPSEQERWDVYRR